MFCLEFLMTKNKLFFKCPLTAFDKDLTFTNLFASNVIEDYSKMWCKDSHMLVMTNDLEVSPSQFQHPLSTLSSEKHDTQ